MLDAALALAGRGWRVFPCDPDSKRPLVPAASAPGEKDGGLWLGTDEAPKLRAWWRTRPRAMIGVRTGADSGFWVLDFDPFEGVGRPKTDPETGEEISFAGLLAGLENQIGEPLPATLTSLTPRGGRHMLFRWVGDVGPDGHGITNSRGAIRSRMIDVRGEGGYVIAPPSVRLGLKAEAEGCAGAAYRWLDPEAEIAEAPAALVDLVLRRGRFARPVAGSGAPTWGHGMAAREAGARVAAGDAEAEAVRRYGLAALDHAVQDIATAAPGTRNETINNRCLSIGHLVGAGAISETIARAALTDAAAALGLPAGDKAFGERGTIARALRDGMAAPADLSHVRHKARERAKRQYRTDAAAPSDEAPMPEGADAYGPQTGAPASPAPSLPRRERGSRTAGSAQPQPQPETHGRGQDAEGGTVFDAEDAGEDERPSGHGIGDVDMEIVRGCAALDHSDTDNAERLWRHFGRDLIVLAQDEVPGGMWLAWTGTHWDIAGGAARVRLIAQQLGGRIGLEAEFLDFTPLEAEAVERAVPLDGLSEDEAGPAEKRILKAAQAARVALEKRRRARRSHGVTSKNHARIEKALECLAPRLRRAADLFNLDRLRFACESHTISFAREIDDECPDPDVRRYTVRMGETAAHERADYITAIVPVTWRGADAPAARWRAFLHQMLPDEEKRRTVQQFAALGLLGVPVQLLMFHYGSGANGKSVFLETLTRVLGPGLAVGLPRESLVGAGERGTGSASPDLARLYGKRFVRILEVKGDVPLQEDLVKKLTGGEAFPVRNLFKGYFEFQNIATPHMSGNGFPTIDGTDHGIWRRMLVVHWDRTVPESEQRNFEEMVSELVREEAPGILAWLVEGARDFLANGLFIADSVRVATADYREEMDPIGQFVSMCLKRVDGGRVQARDLYEAYLSWCMANAKKPRTMTKVGRTIGQHFQKSEYNGRLYYLDCELCDVPERPLETRNPMDT